MVMLSATIIASPTSRGGAAPSLWCEFGHTRAYSAKLRAPPTRGGATQIGGAGLPPIKAKYGLNVLAVEEGCAHAVGHGLIAEDQGKKEVDVCMR